MEVGIEYNSEDDELSFNNSWECRRYDKRDHRYINIYVELYGYNVFGLTKTESFEAKDAYKGVAFRTLFVVEPDQPFSKAGVCFKVRPRVRNGRWSKLECFEAILPPDLVGPPEE